MVKLDQVQYDAGEGPGGIPEDPGQAREMDEMVESIFPTGRREGASPVLVG